MRVFLNHAGEDQDFVLRVGKLLNPHFEKVFCYETDSRADERYSETIHKSIGTSECMIIFVGKMIQAWQVREAQIALERAKHVRRYFFVVQLPDHDRWPDELAHVMEYEILNTKGTTDADALRLVNEVVSKLTNDRLSQDGLPRSAQIFQYEKDIIKYFVQQKSSGANLQRLGNRTGQGVRYLDGCPADWPDVWFYLDSRKFRFTGNQRKMHQEDVGRYRQVDARVVAAALTGYHSPENSGDTCRAMCLTQQGLCFREAGPRETLFYPQRIGQALRDLRVAILVAGGIAPGINAVIDAIVQRHYLYANPHKHADPERYRDTPKYDVHVYGIMNGFQTFFGEIPPVFRDLVPERNEGLQSTTIVTSENANKGGSMIGTSRTDILIIGKKVSSGEEAGGAVEEHEVTAEERVSNLQKVVNQLRAQKIDILYVIGGDGSMRAAHSIWSLAESMRQADPSLEPLSVVAVPKTMDNDILWMWQSFGFMSAVEKGREVIDNLSTEIRSNPRLCVVQLFGSDSGFVVSHAVLASESKQCDVALVPEVKFSMEGLASYLSTRMRKRAKEHGEMIPRGMVVMSETAVPTDALKYVNEEYIGLTEEEKRAIIEFDTMRTAGRRLQGQTDDHLRSAGLKIVSRGLKKLIPKAPANVHFATQPDWGSLRIVVNEPRHLLRAISPSCSDIVMGHRLGTLAVDNAIAGFTDCMISQWLTEYVLVPLDLVVLGRKRIPDTGMFWISAYAKTGQPSDLTRPATVKTTN